MLDLPEIRSLSVAKHFKRMHWNETKRVRGAGSQAKHGQALRKLQRLLSTSRSELCVLMEGGAAFEEGLMQLAGTVGEHNLPAEREELSSLSGRCSMPVCWILEAQRLRHVTIYCSWP